MTDTAAEIAASTAWGRAQGHPQYVWPDVPVAAWRESVAAIERATAQRLAGNTAVSLAAPAGARALGIAGFTTGLGPLLGSWIEAGTLTTDAASADTLRLHLLQGRERWVRITRALRDLLTLLEREQIPVLVLKGAHTALIYFPEPGARPALDIDIVIPPADAPRAAKALTAAGYQAIKRVAPLHRSEWLLPGDTAALRSIDLLHADNPLTVELHTSLARGFHGVRTVRLDPGPGEPYPWPAGGPPARVLRHPHLLAFLALHAAEELHRLRLVQLVELVLVSRRDTPDALDWDAVIALLRAAGALRFAFPALELAERWAPGTVPSPSLTTLRDSAPLALRRLVERMRLEEIDRTPIGAPFAWAATPWEVVRRAAFMVWPQDEGRTVGDVLEIYRRRLHRAMARGDR